MIGRWVGRSAGNWPLEANSNDLSGNANNGSNTDISYVAVGMIGAASFNGSSSKIALSNTQALKPATFTLMSWVKTTCSASVYVIFSNFERDASSNHFGYKFAVDNGHFRAEVANATVTTLFSTTAANDGARHFVAITYDSTTLRIYVDGKLEGTVSGSLSYLATQHPTMGVWLTGSNYSEYFNGYIGGVALLPHVLSDSDIRRCYAWGKGLL
jgi:hypothetical protein